MKSYKLFTEAIIQKSPNVGDYVIVTTIGKRLDPYAPPNSEYFFNNNIGRIEKIDPHLFPNNMRVVYKNIPKEFEYVFYCNHEYNKNNNIKEGITWISITNIKYISKSKKELELKIAAEKYNL